MCKNLKEAKIEEDVIRYVQDNARHLVLNEDKYLIRHPAEFSGGRALTSSDTRDLVIKLCDIYKISVDK